MQKERLIQSFMDMVQIDSLPLNEKEFAEYVIKLIEELGFEITVDDAGKKCGGNVGNVYGFLKGVDSKKSVCFCAHLDTVTPGEGIKPIRKDGKIFTDGTTILAGDDKSGISAIIEGIRTILEDDTPHGDIEVLFTIGEEKALLGSKNIDINMIKSEMIYVLDSDGSVGGIIAYGPTQTVAEYTVFGKAAHAGVEPERGISAIQVAAEAISNMKLLRIDEETTANVGYINAGGPNHIVCDKAVFTSEVRSLKEEKMKAQVKHMCDCVAEAAAKYNTTCEIKTSINYPAFHLDEDSTILKVASEAVKNLDVPLVIKGTGAGSDCNIFNGMGVDTVILACGITNPHSTEESILEEELCKAAKLVEEIIKVV
ncbi:M20/M25/M40 family metallo-hydrolase [Wukongibacter baidiensis]|uniref:M20/M25/M40 family metallo-hydrolase n=1 Tax=Wukongibacter baidiensis TaxID=1723361 RepID=UPI003D7F9DF0